MSLLVTTRPWMLFEKPDDRSGGTDDADAEEPTEEVDDDGPTEEEFETEFEAKLAKEHPELLDEYRDATSGLHSALVKERASARQGKDAAKKLKTYEEREAESQRAQRTKEENLQTDLDAATKRADDAEARLLSLEKERIVLDVAATLNFKTPQDAIAFVDMSSLDIGDDEKADKKTVETVLKDIIKAKPYLLKTSLDEKGNERGGDGRQLDDDPKKKKKFKAEQPKIAI